MEKTASPARALAQAVQSSPTHDRALIAGAEVLLAAAAARGITVTAHDAGNVLLARIGEEFGEVVSFEFQSGSLQLSVTTYGAVHADIEPQAVLLALALQARLAGESAEVDALTGLVNRGGLERRLREAWQDISTGAVALAILDIDFFKAYNDRRGHAAGDAVLRRVAHAAYATLQRADDCFARYGGEEFVAIIRGAKPDEAIAAAERMRHAVAALGIPHADGKAGRVTVSAGVAWGMPAETSAEQLFAFADAQLYRAKSSGRDCVYAEGYIGAQTARARLKPYADLCNQSELLQRIVHAVRTKPLVTVTGSAGIGKTRLALAAASLLAPHFSKIAFAEVWSSLNAADLLARLQPAVAAGKNGLAVLDGCEYLTETVREVIARLRASDVHLLLTSRVPLQAEREDAIRVGPLDPQSSRSLFEQCARSSGVLFEPGGDAVENVLRRMSGVPALIESAAGRLAGSSPAALLEEIAEHGALKAPERMNLNVLVANAIWSLESGRASALASAAVFATAPTSADVAAVFPAGNADEREIEALLRALIPLGLICKNDERPARWHVLDLVRDAVAEHEVTRAARAAAAREHVRWCISKFETLERQFGRVENRELVLGIDPVSREIDSALQRALTNRELTALGMELCCEATRFWFAAGRLNESYRWCEAFLDTARGDDEWRMRLFAALARVAYAQGHIAEMESYASRALQICANDPLRRAALLNYMGIAAKVRGEAEAADRCFRESRDLNSSIGNRRGEAIAIASLGSVAMDLLVEFETAAERFKTAVRIFRELGDDLNAVTIESNLVEVLACAGQVQTAVEIAERILPEARGFGNASTLLLVLSTYVTAYEVLGATGNVQTAVSEVVGLLARLETSQYHTVSDLCGRLRKMRGEKEEAALFFAASEWLQVRSGDPVLPIERYHHARAFEALGLDEEQQQRAMSRARMTSDDELMRLAAQTV